MVNPRNASTEPLRDMKSEMSAKEIPSFGKASGPCPDSECASLGELTLAKGACDNDDDNNDDDDNGGVDDLDDIDDTGSRCCVP